MQSTWLLQLTRSSPIRKETGVLVAVTAAKASLEVEDDVTERLVDQSLKLNEANREQGEPAMILVK